MRRHLYSLLLCRHKLDATIVPLIASEVNKNIMTRTGLEKKSLCCSFEVVAKNLAQYQDVWIHEDVWSKIILHEYQIEAPEDMVPTGAAMRSALFNKNDIALVANVYKAHCAPKVHPLTKEANSTRLFYFAYSPSGNKPQAFYDFAATFRGDEERSIEALQCLDNIQLVKDKLLHRKKKRGNNQLHLHPRHKSSHDLLHQVLHEQTMSPSHLLALVSITIIQLSHPQPQRKQNKKVYVSHNRKKPRNQLPNGMRAHPKISIASVRYATKLKSLRKP